MRRWEKELKEEFEEDELDMEMLGRRFTKQERKNTRVEGKKRRGSEEEN